jgi:hypothetical protein
MIAIALLALLLTSVGCATSTGINTDLVGPGKDSTAVYVDVNALYERHLVQRLYYQNQWSLFLIVDDAKRVGTSLKWGLRYDVYKGVSVIGRGGFSVIPDGGDVDKLAHSWLYGNLEFGLGYKQWSLTLEHISSPFHHATEGDSGINFIKLEYRF